MSENRAALNEMKPLLLVVGVALVAGIWFGLAKPYPALGRWLEPVTASVMVFGGVIELFPVFRPTTDHQRKNRVRQSAIGAASLLAGIGLLIPSIPLRLTLCGLALVLVVAVVRGTPKRLFALR